MEKKCQSNTNNGDTSEEMRSTINNENSSPQNDHVLLSGLSCHDSNRNSQKPVHHQQTEATCVLTFTPEEDTTEISKKDPFSRDKRNVQSESPEVLMVGEITERRLPQLILNSTLKKNHCVAPETFSHLSLHEPFPIFLPVFPLLDNLVISELQRNYSFTSSPIREHTDNAAH